LAACATTGSPPAATRGPSDAASVPASISGQSAYGLFLAGQMAINNGQGSQAAAYFGAADQATKAPDASALLQAHTFTAALLAGDVKGAAQMTPLAVDDPEAQRLASLVRAVEDLAEGAGARARAALVNGEIAAPHAVAAALLAPLAAAQAGQAEAAIALPVFNSDPVASFFASLDQGLLFERAHRYDEAETDFRALIERGDPGAVASRNLGAFLERRGRFADAVATYDQALGRMPGDATLLADRARAAARRPAPALPDVRQTAAEAMTGLASTLAVAKQSEEAVVYLRLALRLDPGQDPAWLLLGDILGSIGDKAGAVSAYLQPKPGSPAFVAARDKLAWSYQADGRKDEALAAAKAAQDGDPDSKAAATTVADLLRADERYPESETVLDHLIDEEGQTPDWRLLYMRAVDYQESDRWGLAEKDLVNALKQQPEEPELLNFLGYSWIDRGERLPEALAMVQKAVDNDPHSGAMVDSLGWAFYRLGRFREAVEKLEQAASMEAGDPEINDHLGDAYWRAGRPVEARFQWSFVLTLQPDAKLRAKIETKLRDGLPEPPPVVGS
jgi:Flp pilus assembly protein TadD